MEEREARVLEELLHEPGLRVLLHRQRRHVARHALGSQRAVLEGTGAVEERHEHARAHDELLDRPPELLPLAGCVRRPVDLRQGAVERLDHRGGSLEPRRDDGDEPRRRELEHGAGDLELELPDAPADLRDAPPPVALLEHRGELRRRLPARRRRQQGRHPGFAGDLLPEEAQLVDAPRRLHQQLPGAEGMAQRQGLVEPVEEEERRLHEVHRGVEELLHLAAHHHEELLRLHELQVDGRLADTLAGALRRAHHLVELPARDDPEAPEDLPQALAGSGRRGPHHVAVVEENRAHALPSNSASKTVSSPL